MDARLILSISGNGNFEILLSGKGPVRRKLFKAFEKSIEPILPTMKRRIKSTLMRNLGGRDENTNPDIN